MQQNNNSDTWDHEFTSIWHIGHFRIILKNIKNISQTNHTTNYLIATILFGEIQILIGCL
jgi:hypothetical protein